MFTTYKGLSKKLQTLKNKSQARVLQSFFKTSSGGYSAGDIFIGIKVPQLRILAQNATELSLSEIKKLIESKIHEERLLGLIILIYQFRQQRKSAKKNIYNFYLKNTQHINNWDLVDLSAPKIVGTYLLTRSQQPLIKLAKSSSLWERRIAIVATHTFIINKRFSPTLKIAKILLNDREDLIHKAVGWMLREVGKKDQSILIDFIVNNYNDLPRTTLRYAIERFPENQRKAFLLGGNQKA